MELNQSLLLGVEGLLIFEINEQEYCSDMKYVTSILNLNEILSDSKKAPKTEIHVHGGAYRFINIIKILNYEDIKPREEARIILFEMFQRKFGFIVNKVNEILTTEEIFINKSLDLVLGSKKKFIKGYLIFENRKILLIDFESITKDLDNLMSVDILDSLYYKRNSYRKNKEV